MRKFLVYICLLITFFCKVSAQDFTSSNLPIVMITTDYNASIPDEPGVSASMKIIYRGPGIRNFVADQYVPEYLNYSGRINIEIRGSSSQSRPKKSYGFTTYKADNFTTDNVSLMGMPEENDWILNGMVWDPCLIRDYLCFNLARELGEYASRTVYCELYVNSSYKGLYILGEKIKSDKSRVDIIEINSGDNYIPSVTGGYITKADKTTGGDPVAWTMQSWYGGGVNYIHHEPKPTLVTAYQNNYIQNYFFTFANAAQAGNTSLFSGYPQLIDIPSFIHHIIISELSSNADSYGLSTFFHKDREGKLRAGPIWDSDLTFGNDLFLWGFDRSHTDVWQLSDGGNDGSRFWKDLFQNPDFRCYLSRRWNELIQPGRPLNPAVLEGYIDQTVSYISEAVVKENIKWGTIGNHAEGIANMKSWINTRIAWMTANLGSYAACSNVQVPPLVISGINYNPPSSTWFPGGEDLEFIEIRNTGSLDKYLTGIYFGGTGLVYQFPYGTIIPGDTSFFIASNATAFEWKYGFKPFDEYSRHLSNGGQSISLLDAFGNLIDFVQYSDTVPWPEADGNGLYLKLNDPFLDNNDPLNWSAVNDVILSNDEKKQISPVRLIPNPVEDWLKINSEEPLRSIQVSDITGRRNSEVRVSGFNYEIDLSRLPAGVYFIRINLNGRSVTEKVIKK